MREKLGNGECAKFCTAAPPPIHVLGVLVRTGEVEEEGWEWESGGGRGVEKVDVGMAGVVQGGRVGGGRDAGG